MRNMIKNKELIKMKKNDDDSEDKDDDDDVIMLHGWLAVFPNISNPHGGTSKPSKTLSSAVLQGFCRHSATKISQPNQL